jgi:hypothetical protein
MADTLIDMKRSAPDPDSGPAAMPVNPEGEQYPYGLQITLCDEELAKLGISAMPAVGTEVHGTFAGMITSARQEPGEEGEQSLSIQIMYLGLKAEKPHPGEGKETAADESRENGNPGLFRSLNRHPAIVS